MARWMRSGHVAHVQVNDANRRGPGQGELRFGPILKTVLEMQAAVGKAGGNHSSRTLFARSTSSSVTAREA